MKGTATVSGSGAFEVKSWCPWWYPSFIKPNLTAIVRFVDAPPMTTCAPNGDDSVWMTWVRLWGSWVLVVHYEVAGTREIAWAVGELLG
jgi:hypothetical protein